MDGFSNIVPMCTIGGRYFFGTGLPDMEMERVESDSIEDEYACLENEPPLELAYSLDGV